MNQNQYGQHPNSMFHAGFSNTNLDQVRQQNQQSGMGSGGSYGNLGYASQISNMGSHPASMFSSNFSNTDPNQVRQQNQQSAHNFSQFPQSGAGYSNYGAGYQQGGYSSMAGFSTAAPYQDPRIMFQPNFSNTDVNQVRQQNQQSQMNLMQSPQGGAGYSNYGAGYQQGGYSSMAGFSTAAPYQDPRIMFQPNFSNTDVNQVRQQNQQSQMNLMQAPQSGAGYGQSGQFSPSPQGMMNPNFSNTNVNQVRQQNQQSGGYYSGY